MVKSCSEGQQAQPLPTSAPMQPWSWPALTTVQRILKIWSTRIDCVRQLSTVCCSRISRILQEKWDSTHPYCTHHPYRAAWQNEVYKHSREATRNSRKGLWKIAWLDLCCNMQSRHTQPLDIVPQSYCLEESYALVWTLSNRTLESLLKRTVSSERES